MKKATFTEKDHEAFQRISSKIEHLKLRTSRDFPEYMASDWQFLESVVESGITRGRINRLVSLGLLESKPSDGLGQSIRVNPNYRRYL